MSDMGQVHRFVSTSSILEVPQLPDDLLHRGI